MVGTSCRTELPRSPRHPPRIRRYTGRRLGAPECHHQDAVHVVTGLHRRPIGGSRSGVGHSDDVVLETCLVLTSIAMRTDMTKAHHLHIVSEPFPPGEAPHRAGLGPRLACPIGPPYGRRATAVWGSAAGAACRSWRGAHAAILVRIGASLRPRHLIRLGRRPELIARVVVPLSRMGARRP